MCHPLAIAAGAVQTVGGIMQAQAQHKAAKAAAARQNQINELNYQNNLNIAKRKDQAKADEYNRQLNAHAAATSALYRQRELNQKEHTRASIAAQQVLEEKLTEASFESQQKLVAQIQAQGTVLASGQQAGQSLLLSLMDTERQLGFQEAQLNRSIVDANKGYRIADYGFNLDRYSADQSAMNRMPGAPVAQSASFAPIREPEVQGPSSLGLMGGIISSVGAGVSTTIGVQGAGVKAGLWKPKALGGG